MPHRGVRILVDRLWPRGLTKDVAAIDQWVRDCAPSDKLRSWFAHDRERWPAFKRRYFAELRRKPVALAPICALAKSRRVTLLFAAADTECNNAVALMEYLGGKGRRERRSRRKNSPARKAHSSILR